MWLIEPDMPNKSDFLTRELQLSGNLVLTTLSLVQDFKLLIGLHFAANSQTKRANSSLFNIIFNHE